MAEYEDYCNYMNSKSTSRKAESKLILRLAKNDFKARFAGSYLGIFWAFVNPIVTILVYWFVFEKGLNAGGVTTHAGVYVPFVLWLIAGMVPWFYFSEAVSSGTNTLLEYSYLVKKIVFNVNVLPFVKIISAGVVPVILIVLSVLLYWAYGCTPDLYTLQVIYYSFAMVCLVLGLVYINSALVVFFRDMSQLVGVLMQVWVWVTPIMWNLDGMIDAGTIPHWAASMFKANPVYYITAGYRDSLIHKVWFWERPELTICFWIVTTVIFIMGQLVFRRLKPHFADVL